MDMAVANLLKRKINFHLMYEENRYHEKELRYTSMLINKLNIGGRPHWWVYMNSIRPFIVHFISTFVTEESECIDYIAIFVKWLILREGAVIFNPFPNKPWFSRVCSTSLLKTLREKEKLLITSNFSFSHSVFYPL